MQIQVVVKPRARENSVERVDEARFIVRTTALPADNEANEAVIALLAEYLRVAKSCIRLRSGGSSREKRFEVLR